MPALLSAEAICAALPSSAGVAAPLKSGAGPIATGSANTVTRALPACSHLGAEDHARSQDLFRPDVPGQNLDVAQAVLRRDRDPVFAEQTRQMRRYFRGVVAFDGHQNQAEPAAPQPADL